MKARAVAAAVLLSVQVTVAVNAQETGSVCLAPVKEPTPGMKSLYNDTGGNPDPDYTIQFDLRAPVQMPRGAEPSTLVEGLDGRRIPPGNDLLSTLRDAGLQREDDRAGAGVDVDQRQVWQQELQIARREQRLDVDVNAIAGEGHAGRQRRMSQRPFRHRDERRRLRDAQRQHRVVWQRRLLVDGQRDGNRWQKARLAPA